MPCLSTQSVDAFFDHGIKWMIETGPYTLVLRPIRASWGAQARVRPDEWVGVKTSKVLCIPSSSQPQATQPPTPAINGEQTRPATIPRIPFTRIRVVKASVHWVFLSVSGLPRRYPGAVGWLIPIPVANSPHQLYCLSVGYMEVESRPVAARHTAHLARPLFASSGPRP